MAITVTTDVYGYQYEYNAVGTAESNNAAGANATVTIAPYADLQVQNLAVSPGSLLTGQTMHITWDNANTGNLATNTNWYDRIVVVNSTTGTTVLNTTVYHTHATEGAVAAGWNLTRLVRGCARRESAQPATPTGVSIRLDDARGELTCGEGPDQISAFSVKRDGSDEPAQGAGCADSVEIVGLEAGTSYSFSVQAFEAGASKPRWATQCHRKAVSGAVVPAACDLLTELSD